MHELLGTDSVPTQNEYARTVMQRQISLSTEAPAEKPRRVSHVLQMKRQNTYAISDSMEDFSAISTPGKSPDYLDYAMTSSAPSESINATLRHRGGLNTVREDEEEGTAQEMPSRKPPRFSEVFPKGKRKFSDDPYDRPFTTEPEERRQSDFSLAFKPPRFSEVFPVEVPESNCVEPPPGPKPFEIRITSYDSTPNEALSLDSFDDYDIEI